MLPSDRAVLDGAYASWAAGDLATTLDCFAEDVEFEVHSPPDAPSFVGKGHGKWLLAPRLEAFLENFEVVSYSLLQVVPRDDGALVCRVSYHYRHTATGMEIDGKMRHVWRIRGDKIVRFELFHDAKRMGAFYQMVTQASALV